MFEYSPRLLSRYPREPPDKGRNICAILKIQK